jgi:hypothetical protein
MPENHRQSGFQPPASPPSVTVSSLG